MKTEEYMLDEIKRLNKLNSDLEKYMNDKNSTTANLAIYEQIQKNTLAMCEIAKVCN